MEIMDLSVGQLTTLTGLNKGPTLEQLDHIFWKILTSWTFDQNFQHYNIYPFFFS